MSTEDSMRTWVVPWLVLIGLAPLTACPTESRDTVASTAPAVQTPVQPIATPRPPAAEGRAKQAGAKLVGTWRLAKGASGSTKRPVDKQSVLELRADGTYRQAFPGLEDKAPRAWGKRVLEGMWQIKSVEGEEMLMERTLSSMGEAFPLSPQRIRLRDGNTLEMRNAENEHGVVYTRVADQ
jgi:hypothetical protein